MATYHTRQKEAILALLTDSRGEALSASELLARLTRSGSSIGRTTVYRLLSQLVDDGVVRAWRDASRGITLYELSVITDCADVRCRKCERIFHLHCQALAALQASMPRTVFCLILLRHNSLGFVLNAAQKSLNF